MSSAKRRLFRLGLNVAGVMPHRYVNMVYDACRSRSLYFCRVGLNKANEKCNNVGVLKTLKLGYDKVVRFKNVIKNNAPTKGVDTE